MNFKRPITAADAVAFQRFTESGELIGVISERVSVAWHGGWRGGRAMLQRLVLSRRPRAPPHYTTYKSRYTPRHRRKLSVAPPPSRPLQISSGFGRGTSCEALRCSSQMRLMSIYSFDLRYSPFKTFNLFACGSPMCFILSFYTAAD